MAKFFIRDPGPFLESHLDAPENSWEDELKAERKKDARVVRWVAATSLGVLSVATAALVYTAEGDNAPDLTRSFVETVIPAHGGGHALVK